MAQEADRKKDLQERLLNQLLRVFAVAGIVAYIPSAYLSVKAGVWVILAADTAAFAFVIVLASFPRLPFRLKLVSVLVICYALGLALLFITGPTGAGHLFIFAFVFLMALFADLKTMVAANVLAVVTHLGFAVGSAFHLLAWEQSFDSVVVISANFVLISLVLSVAAHSLIHGYIGIARRERDLREQLELMLQEIEHRVKNNLQVISSLIRVRMRGSKDPARTMEDIRESLSAISAVHQLLYRHETFYLVGVQALLEALADHFRILHLRITLSLDWAGPGAELDMERAVSLGILVNEIVINSVKHAFPVTGGKVFMAARYDQNEGILDLEIGDDGRGMEEGQSTGSGTRIIVALAQQLRASMTVRRNQGVWYRFQMPVRSVSKPEETSVPRTRRLR